MLIIYIIYIISLLYLLFLSIKDNGSYQRFIVKMINCSLFVVIFILNYFTNKVSNYFFVPMLIAFILSLIGDLGLGYSHVKKNKITKGIGFISFSLAQIVFIYSFISNFGFKLYLLFIPILGVLMGLYFAYKLKIKENGIYVVMSIYLTLLSMMFTSTLSAYINLQNKLSIILLVGGITFAISDYTLLFKYYDQKHKNIFTVISVLTYGVAQLLFATSILFM